jgi:sarcosine oxidase gamma subunit
VEDVNLVGETIDPDGGRVVLFDAVWRKKIVRDHPEVGAYMSAVLQAVATPDHVAHDPIFAERTRYYVQGVGPSQWLLVVVSYEQTPARIVSAFANRKDPKSWSA